MFTIDPSDADRFAQAMTKVPKEMQTALQRTTNGLLSAAVVDARSFVNSKSGHLAGNIRILQPAAVGPVVTGRYGVRLADVVYARQREKGGVIKARNSMYLKFQINGHWVQVKSVTQTGSHYMRRSREKLKPRIRPAYSRAVTRVLANVGG